MTTTTASLTSTHTTATATTTTRSTIKLRPLPNIDEQVAELFEDYQQNGTISADAFKDLLDTLGLEDESFSAADTDGDGKLGLREVQQAIKKGYISLESMDLNGGCTLLASLIVQLAMLTVVLSHL